MSWGSALFLFAAGVFLPTFDSYTDAWMSARLFLGNNYQSDHCEKREEAVPPHPYFGKLTLGPIFLTWIFVARHWFVTERGLMQKLKTFPLVILQVYPQWKALQVLYAAKWKKQRDWQKMKEEYENGLSHLGKNIFKNTKNDVANIFNFFRASA